MTTTTPDITTTATTVTGTTTTGTTSTGTTTGATTGTTTTDTTATATTTTGSTTTDTTATGTTTGTGTNTTTSDQGDDGVGDDSAPEHHDASESHPVVNTAATGTATTGATTGGTTNSGTTTTGTATGGTGTTTTTADHSGDGEVDAEGYEHHAASASNPVVKGSVAHSNVLTGAGTDDTLIAGPKGDVINGGTGNNTLQGGAGNDILIGSPSSGHGQNHLDGGAGDDILVAGGTKTSYMDDFLAQHQSVATTISTDLKYADLASIQSSAVNNSGGGVTNVFEFHSGSGNDQILNFHASSDKIQIDRGVNNSDIQDMQSLLQHVTVSGNDVAIDLGHGNSVTLVGVDVAALTAANIALV